MSGLAALTERSLMDAVRDGGLIFELVSPVAYLAGLTVALSGLVDTGSVSYAQYLVPAVVVQSMIFVALFTADRAARDHQFGLGKVLRALPIAAVAPVAGRMAATLMRARSFCWSRFSQDTHSDFACRADQAMESPSYSWRCSCVRQWRCSPMRWVRVPTVLKGQPTCFSSPADALLPVHGIAPEETFPGWLRPFVRNQPVSLVVETLRGLATGHVAAGNLAASPRLVFGHDARLRRDHAADAEAKVMSIRADGSLLTHSWVQAARLLMRWRRDPAVMIGSILLPICLMLIYQVVLGEQVRKVTGVESVYSLVPLCAVLSALFGALGDSVGIQSRSSDPDDQPNG